MATHPLLEQTRVLHTQVCSNHCAQLLVQGWREVAVSGAVRAFVHTSSDGAANQRLMLIGDGKLATVRAPRLDGPTPQQCADWLRAA